MKVGDFHRREELTLRLGSSPKKRKLEQFQFCVVHAEAWVFQKRELETNWIGVAIKQPFRVVLQSTHVLFTIVAKKIFGDPVSFFPISNLFSDESLSGMCVDQLSEGL